MLEKTLAPALLGLALSVGSFLGTFTGAANAAVASATALPEASLRAELQQAVWPGDIAELAGSYLRSYPQGQASASASVMLAGATEALRLLERNDVRLYRTSFQAVDLTPEARADLRKATLGDKEAALRLAHLHRPGSGSAPNVNRYVGWLQFASMLGQPDASYELSVHFRRDNQPALAANYETRAEQLGYIAPVALDNIRK